MQCYIVLYSSEGCFLTFTKRTRSYFFHNSDGSGGVIYPNGVALNNGPGLFAFPGGALDDGEQPFEGCLREFIEECGAQISFGFFPLNEPQTLETLSNVTIDGNQYNIIYSILNTVNNDYCVLYLEFENTDLEQIETIILDTNFEDASNAVAEIIDGNFGSYDAIFNIYPFCPLDNELRDIEIWQIQNQINEIELLNQNQATGWYYNMIVYLANDILDANIPY
jgi:8-oxo-dGTP pyrophosphatase MutT (NUDIX family)